SRQCRTLLPEIHLRFPPGLLRDLVAELAAIAIPGPEMNSAIHTRPPGGIGRLGEGIPAEANFLRRTDIVLQPVRWEYDFIAQGIAAGELPEQRRAGSAECAMAGHVLGRCRGG